MNHLVPEYDNTYEYNVEHDNFISKLAKKMNLAHYGARFSPYLFEMPIEIQEQIQCVHPVLVKAVKNIVENYVYDNQLQQAISLNDHQMSLIKKVSDKPYCLFSIRPDFLISEEGEIKLCEINARFTINGFVSAFYLHQQHKENFPDHSGLEDELSCVMSSYLSRFDLSKPLFLMREKERGYDLNLLKSYLINRNVCVVDVKPSELSLVNGMLMGHDVVCEQMIMELHQSELEAIPDSIITYILSNINYVNDIRTILIAHDKRLFHVLSRKDIMRKYLSNNEVDVLSKYVIPTYPLTQVKSNVLNDPENWVLKKCLSGKGEGMYIGAESSREDIQMIVSEKSLQYIAQPFVHQKKINVFIDGEYQQCNAVGMILSLNGDYHGAGFLRASPSSIVAVSRGGCIVALSFK